MRLDFGHEHIDDTRQYLNAGSHSDPDEEGCGGHVVPIDESRHDMLRLPRTCVTSLRKLAKAQEPSYSPRR